MSSENVFPSSLGLKPHRSLCNTQYPTQSLYTLGHPNCGSKLFPFKVSFSDSHLNASATQYGHKLKVNQDLILLAYSKSIPWTWLTILGFRVLCITLYRWSLRLLYAQLLFIEFYNISEITMF